MGELEHQLARIGAKLREREQAILRWLPEAAERGERAGREHGGAWGSHVATSLDAPASPPTFYMKVGPGGGQPCYVVDTRERLLARYCQMNPPLAPAEVEVFEARWGVTLPEEYRAFLLDIGNGGAGPYYGLLSLAQSTEELAPCLAEDAAYLSRPFPLTTRLSLPDEFQRRTGRHPFEARPKEPKEKDDRALRAREAAFLAEFAPRRYRRGTLFICEYGCGIVFSLVVSGAERGNVWLDDFANDSGLFPVRRRAHPDAHLGFFDWYESWLDHDLSRWLSQDEPDCEREDPFVWFE